MKYWLTLVQVPESDQLIEIAPPRPPLASPQSDRGPAWWRLFAQVSLEASLALGFGGFVFFLFYLPLYNSTQNTAGVPQERTPLQIVCAPAPVRIFRRPSSIKRRPESLESKHRSSKSL